MREMAAKAYLYKFEMGDRSAIEGARIMAAETENPALAARLAAAAAPI